MIIVDSRGLHEMETTQEAALRRGEGVEECEIEDTLSDDERRRFIALDQAIRVSSGGAHGVKAIVEDAKTFEAFLKGE